MDHLYNSNVKNSKQEWSIPLPITVLNLATYQPKPPQPLNHLRGKDIFKYVGEDMLNNSCNKLLLSDSLEVYNRSGVRPLNKPLNGPLERPLGNQEITEIAQYFFECIGKAKVVLRFCTQCMDDEKQRNMFDWYFIDITEISQQRTILCLTCMNDLLRKYVHGKDVMGRLMELRRQQPNGVYVDPFLISCGY